MGSLTKPWLCLPAGLAHSLSQYVLKYYGRLHAPDIQTWGEFHWRNLQFANPLGIAGGVDKNGEYLSTFWSWGCGFLEVGTVTPQPQDANPGVILRRDNSKRALWNKMGFPNQGVAHLKKNLQKLARPYKTPVFINIGRNRTTSNENAVQDYLFCIRELREFADAFVVNISSPNTSGLRELMQPQKLASFLKPLIDECDDKIPLLLKLSPDLTNEEWQTALDISYGAGVHGWVIANTTTNREMTPGFPVEGGVSGAPVAKRADELLKITVQHLGERKNDRLIVSVGGVMSEEDVMHRLRMGANLVQVYSALIFYGPTFFHDVAKRAAK